MSIDYQNTLRESVEAARLRFVEARDCPDTAEYRAALEAYREVLKVFSNLILRGR